MASGRTQASLEPSHSSRLGGGFFRPGRVMCMNERAFRGAESVFIKLGQRQVEFRGGRSARFDGGEQLRLGAGKLTGLGEQPGREQSDRVRDGSISAAVGRQQRKLERAIAIGRTVRHPREPEVIGGIFGGPRLGQRCVKPSEQRRHRHDVVQVVLEDDRKFGRGFPAKI